jgi:hypothetical protein
MVTGDASDFRRLFLITAELRHELPEFLQYHISASDTPLVPTSRDARFLDVMDRARRKLSEIVARLGRV